MTSPPAPSILTQGEPDTSQQWMIVRTHREVGGCIGSAEYAPTLARAIALATGRSMLCLDVVKVYSPNGELAGSATSGRWTDAWRRPQVAS